MSISPHNRALDHYGTEDDETAVLSAAIGRYAAGVTVHSVLVDMAARLSAAEAAPCELRIFALAADAVISKGQTSSFTANAYISDPSHNLTLDAVIAAVQTSSFTANAVLIERMPGAAALDGAIDAIQTTITVTSAAGFPQSGTYVINIGSEQLLVTGGQGTLVWTVTRGYNSTTAASHPDGTAVTEEC